MWEVTHKGFGETLLVKMFGTPHTPDTNISPENRYFDFSKSEVTAELGISKQAFQVL